MSEISVFGSINMDLSISVAQFPSKGETVKAEDFEQLPGGKGANQSVAAANLGGEVSIYGLLGDGPFAGELRKSLREEGVNVGELDTRSGTSGLAVVSVDKTGENKIIIVPGANGLVDRKYIDDVIESISSTNTLLLQLETPLNANIGLLKRLPEYQKPKVILDPAPAVHFSRLPLELIDILTPNESELEILIRGMETREGIRRLLDSGLGALVLKKGEEGAEYISSEKRFSVPAFDVSPVDSTGAGDAFNGALAVALAEGFDIREALEFANAAGAYSTEKKGAQPSTLEREKVKKIINHSQKKV